MEKFLISFIIFGCLSTNVSAQVLHRNAYSKEVYSYNGNQFGFSKPMSFNAAGAARKSTPAPVLVNGEKIYRSGHNIDNEPQLTSHKSFSSYISEKMKPVFAKLPDGRYMMPTFNLVIDKKGKLIFYDFREIAIMSGNVKRISGEGTEEHMGMAFSQVPGKNKNETQGESEISENLRQELNRAMEDALVNAPMFTPAMASGKKVCCLLFPNYDFNDFIIVKDGQVSFEGGLKLPVNE